MTAGYNLTRSIKCSALTKIGIGSLLNDWLKNWLKKRKKNRNKEKRKEMSTSNEQHLPLKSLSAPIHIC